MVPVNAGSPSSDLHGLRSTPGKAISTAVVTRADNNDTFHSFLWRSGVCGGYFPLTLLGTHACLDSIRLGSADHLLHYRILHVRSTQG